MKLKRQMVLAGKIQRVRLGAQAEAEDLLPAKFSRHKNGCFREPKGTVRIDPCLRNDSVDHTQKRIRMQETSMTREECPAASVVREI